MSFTAMVQRGSVVTEKRGSGPMSFMERRVFHNHGTAGLSQSWNNVLFKVMEQCVFHCSHGTEMIWSPRSPHEGITAWERDKISFAGSREQNAVEDQ